MVLMIKMMTMVMLTGEGDDGDGVVFFFSLLLVISGFRSQC